MDIYTTSFNYPRLLHPTYSPSSSLDFTPDIKTPRDPYSPVPYLQHAHPLIQDSQATDVGADAIQRVVVAAMQAHSCLVSFTKAERGKGWNFHISGGYQQVMAARGIVLRDCPLSTTVTIKANRADVIDSPVSSPSLKPDVRQRLDEIASQTMAHIAVVNPTSSFTLSTDAVNNGFAGLETERICELVVSGASDCVEVARVRLLVMLDELSGLHSDICEIEQKLHPIVAARKRSAIQSIQEETATNIYFLSPLQGLVGPPCPSAMEPSQSISGPVLKQSPSVIWITGEFFGVQRARDMLTQMSVLKSKTLISRDCALVPRKLDWMLTDRMDELKTIMSDNATFISFPALGSQTSLITIYGDNRATIQRTVRSIMQLACQFYVASFWLLPLHFNVLMPTPSINPAQMSAYLKRISNVTNAEVVFKGNCFEMHGLEHEVRAAVAMVLELDVVKNFHHEIRFQIELANEHREFISGKKNGKLNKIMQMTNAKIKFETFNEQNFLIDLSGSDTAAIQGLVMLQEELPAEISFHVPEAYHKRIIGVGGRSIQRIMKKHGVYVKFSNAEEFAALGGYADNEDNVIARTPAKNAINLDNLKQSVMEIVNPKDKDYVYETVSIPRKYHRTLLGEKSIFIHDIESKTNSRIRFPDKETASDIVSIFGPESQVAIASAMLLEYVPFEADFTVPPHPELPRFVTSPDFMAFLERVSRDLEVDITPFVKPSRPPSLSSLGSSTSFESSPESFFRFSCLRSNSDVVANAREMLESFLISNNIQIFRSARGQHRRADSFADAFPHFNSKLLSASTAHTPESPDFLRASHAGASPDKRIRMASSTPDVKALFNSSPSYVYKLPEHDEADEAASTYSGSEYWPRMSPMHRGQGIALHRHRHQEDPLKRGSDSLIEAKLKEHAFNKPRSLTNRAQSLDLTFSLSRITEQSSRLPPPPSPTNSTEGTGGNSSPTTGSAPTFPSVYGPPTSLNPFLDVSSLHSPPIIGPNIPEDQAEVADEVARVISNLRL